MITYCIIRMGLIDALSGKLSDSSLPKYKDQNYDKVRLRKYLTMAGFNENES